MAALHAPCLGRLSGARGRRRLVHGDDVELGLELVDRGQDRKHLAGGGRRGQAQQAGDQGDAVADAGDLADLVGGIDGEGDQVLLDWPSEPTTQAAASP